MLAFADAVAAMLDRRDSLLGGPVRLWLISGDLVSFLSSLSTVTPSRIGVRGPGSTLTSTLVSALSSDVVSAPVSVLRACAVPALLFGLSSSTLR